MSFSIPPAQIGQLLKQHGYKGPAQLDRNVDGTIGVATVDFITNEMTGTYLFGRKPENGITTDISPTTHGQMVQELLTSGISPLGVDFKLYDIDQWSYVKGPTKEQETNLELSKVLQDVIKGTIDVVNLSQALTYTLRDIRTALKQPELTLADLSKPEVRKNLLTYLESNEPETHKAISLVAQIKQAGGIVIVGTGNRPGDYINLFALADPIMVGASDNDSYTKNFESITAPSYLKVIPVKNDMGSVVGFSYDDEPDMDAPLSKEAQKAIAPYVGKRPKDCTIPPEELKRIFANPKQPQSPDDSRLVSVDQLKQLMTSSSSELKKIPANTYISLAHASQFLPGNLHFQLSTHSDQPSATLGKYQLTLNQQGKLIFNPPLNITPGGTSSSTPRAANQIIRYLLQEELPKKKKP